MSSYRCYYLIFVSSIAEFVSLFLFGSIQKFIPTDIDTCIECRLYFRLVLFAVCGGAAVAAAFFAATMLPFR